MSHEPRRAPPARIAAGRRRGCPAPQVLHDHHRDHEVGEGDEPCADRPPGAETSVAPVEGFVVLGDAELPDDEEHDDHELREPVERGAAAHEVVGVVRPLQDVAEVAVLEVADHRDAVGERGAQHARRAEHHAEHHDERHCQAPDVAPPGRRCGHDDRVRRRRGRRSRRARRRRGRRRKRRRRRLRHRADRTGTRAMTGTAGQFATALCQTRHHAAREAQLEAPLLRGRHVGAVHRVRRVRHRLPARRARLPRHRRASTSRSSSRRGGGPDNCSHGEKSCTSCTRACPRFRAWEPDIDEFMFGRARTNEEASGIYKDIVLARATDPVLAEVGQDGGLVSAILLYALEHDMIDAALGELPRRRRHHVEGDPGRGAARVKTSSRRPGAATPTPPTPWRTPKPSRAAPSASRLVGMSCQSSVPPVMKQRKAGKVARRLVAQHRAAVLQDVRRRHLRGALRGQVRPEEGRHEEDEHQGRLPDLDEQRRLPRDPAQGVPRLDARGLQDVPRLRGRARRHLHRRDRRVQRLDAHHRAHRRRPRAHGRPACATVGSRPVPATTTRVPSH